MVCSSVAALLNANRYLLYNCYILCLLHLASSLKFRGSCCEMHIM
jgi:hypothetical protein